MVLRKLYLFTIIAPVLAIKADTSFHIDTDSNSVLISPPNKTSENFDSPIAIESSKVKPLSNVPPLLIQIFSVGNSTLSNDGYSAMLNFKAVSDNATRIYLSGGPLGSNNYSLYGIFYLWSNETNGIAGTTVDGVGGPVEADPTFLNLRYETFDEAIKYPDGLAVVSFLVSLTNETNRFFDSFSPFLSQVSDPGRKVDIPMLDAFNWFNTLEFVKNYLAYAGSYMDFKTKQNYKCATIMVIPSIPGKRPFISTEQFQNSWSRVNSESGEPLVTARSYPQKDRSVYNASGIDQMNDDGKAGNSALY